MLLLRCRMHVTRINSSYRECYYSPHMPVSPFDLPGGPSASVAGNVQSKVLKLHLASLLLLSAHFACQSLSIFSTDNNLSSHSLPYLLTCFLTHSLTYLLTYFLTNLLTSFALRSFSLSRHNPTTQTRMLLGSGDRFQFGYGSGT
jgi:hypothetical protein